MLTSTTGTTIPAFTAVMSGTPSGVGALKTPKRFLNHNEVVEVEITRIGVLKNKILFPEGKQPVL
jgi:2-keto-4-pentenoate hydratase/2-oxohepta-3-ene-1,7-dioic acid hydratase in catechol pathway